MKRTTPAQHFTPRATLAAIGSSVGHLRLFDTISQHLKIKQKTFKYRSNRLARSASSLLSIRSRTNSRLSSRSRARAERKSSSQTRARTGSSRWHRRALS